MFDNRASPYSGCEEYNQSDLGIDHLVMSMYKVILCCWKGVFVMPSVFSWQNSEGESEKRMKERKARTSVGVHK